MRRSPLSLAVLLSFSASFSMAAETSAQVAPSSSTPATAPAPMAISAPVPKPTVEKALAFLNPAKGWSVNATQRVDFDQKLWTREALGDGSEIFSYQAAKSKEEEQKRAILRDGENLSSISSYQLAPAKKGAKIQEERSASVVFHKGDLFAVTQCRDDGTKLGRNCITVTPDVCEYVKEEEPKEFPKKVSEQLKVLEIRALATILTLRGTNHQLENVARHGNRLGLNNPLQTTKGKLISKNKDLVKRVKADAKALCAAFASNKI